MKEQVLTLSLNKKSRKHAAKPCVKCHKEVCSPHYAVYNDAHSDFIRRYCEKCVGFMLSRYTWIRLTEGRKNLSPSPAVEMYRKQYAELAEQLDFAL
jgi:hypothetical protein